MSRLCERAMTKTHGGAIFLRLSPLRSGCATPLILSRQWAASSLQSLTLHGQRRFRSPLLGARAPAPVRITCNPASAVISGLAAGWGLGRQAREVQVCRRCFLWS